jgi:tetratricopeptide (TPR) repeat protein
MQTLTYEQIPDASSFNSELIGSYPLAEHTRVVDGPYQPHDAYMLSVQGKNEEAERALREIIEHADPANAWLARMELGTLDFGQPGGNTEANRILLDCVGCEFLDVARNAAWNLSELLKQNNFSDKSKGYADLAVKLHNSLAMVVVAERLQEQGLEAEALDAFEFAAKNTLRIDDFRSRIEVGLSAKRTAGVKPQAAEYFAEGLGVLQRSHFSSSNFYVNTREQFNTEVGSASISTRYFDECEAKCYFEPIQIDCGICGRNPGNYISVPSGDGDGVYPVFTFMSKEHGDLGHVTMFRRLFDELVSYGESGDGSTVSPA